MKKLNNKAVYKYGGPVFGIIICGPQAAEKTALLTLIAMLTKANAAWYSSKITGLCKEDYLQDIIIIDEVTNLNHVKLKGSPVETSIRQPYGKITTGVKRPIIVVLTQEPAETFDEVRHWQVLQLPEDVYKITNICSKAIDNRR